jgi:hypothetical protein
MKQGKMLLILLAFAMIFALLSACDSGGSGGDPEPEPEPAVTVIAINETFDAWDGDFFMARPEGGSGTYDDNGTVIADLDGHTNVLCIHDTAEDNNGYGYSIEVQLPLDQQTDFSGEDFHITFDIYVPQATADLGDNVQWGLYETTGFTPIYSGWWSGSLVADGWATISTPISTSGSAGNVDYSGFTNDPADWQLDVVRFNLIVNGADAGIGDEVLFYIDNIVISNEPAAE